jgi:tRNA (guanine37-N1)-methyltransferase
LSVWNTSSTLRPADQLAHDPENRRRAVPVKIVQRQGVDDRDPGHAVQQGLGTGHQLPEVGQVEVFGLAQQQRQRMVAEASRQAIDLLEAAIVQMQDTGVRHDISGQPSPRPAERSVRHLRFFVAEVYRLEVRHRGPVRLLPCPGILRNSSSMSKARALRWLCWTNPASGGIKRRFGACGGVGEPMAAWKATVLTIFPEMFPGPLGVSLAGKALEKGAWALEVLDIRDFARDKHRSVDDTPFGGGAGMVMRPDVVDAALARVEDEPGRLLYLSPRGRLLTQPLVRELALGPGVRLLCGRYEGVDERVLQARAVVEVSIGDYILSGGEPAAMVLLDAAIRLLPGVLGNELSPDEESFEQGLLEYPHYTRPAEWQGRNVPEVLTSGHHEEIRRWRRARAEELTKRRRPDLWAGRRRDENDV